MISSYNSSQTNITKTPIKEKYVAMVSLTEATLSSTPCVEGRFYHTIDTNEFYFDWYSPVTKNLQHIQLELMGASDPNILRSYVTKNDQKEVLKDYIKEDSLLEILTKNGYLNEISNFVKKQITNGTDINTLDKRVDGLKFEVLEIKEVLTEKYMTEEDIENTFLKEIVWEEDDTE